MAKYQKSDKYKQFMGKLDIEIFPFYTKIFQLKTNLQPK
jgi:hypothetical protein